MVKIFINFHFPNLQGLNFYFTAKFNCIVPGTLLDYDCAITTFTARTISMLTDSISDSTMTNLNLIATSIHTTFNTNPSHQAIHVLAGLGGGILVFIFCIITVCICFCLRLARRKRQVLTFTAENVYSMDDGEQPQQEQMHGT